MNTSKPKPMQLKDVKSSDKPRCDPEHVIEFVQRVGNIEILMCTDCYERLQFSMVKDLLKELSFMSLTVSLTKENDK